MDGSEGVEQMEAGDGAAGAVSFFRVGGEDEGGTAGAVDDARGEDAEDAAMPLRVIEDEAPRRDVGRRGVRRVRSWSSMASRAAASVARRRSLLRSSSLVARARARDRVAGKKELDDIGGDIHAACGVDAGCDAKADLRSGGSAVEGEVGNLHEGAEAGLDRVGELAQAEHGEGAVFAGEGDGVGNGGDGDELEEAGEKALVEVALLLGGGGVGGQQGVGELEGYGGAAKVLVGVRAAGLGGVDDGDGFWECLRCRRAGGGR